MSITQVQANTTGTTGPTSPFSATLGTGITLGNLLTVTLNWGDSSGSLVITPPDGSWAQAVLHQSTGFAAVAIYYLVIDSGHAGQTSWSFSFNNAHNGNLCAQEWHSSTGWPASALADKTADNSGSGTAVASGTTATTTANAELWLAGLASNSTGSWSGVTAGWTSTSHNSAANTLLTAWQPVTSTGTAGMSATNSVSNTWGGAVAALKAVQPAGGARSELLAVFP